MKVSILIPNYNHARFLSRSIQSALDQTYPDIEIIIVDDGSNDGSVEIIKDFAANNPRIQPVYCVENMGFPVAFKLCTQVCTGEIVYGLASDDFILRNDFISECVDRFKSFPEIGLVWAKTELRYEDGEFFGQIGQCKNLFPTNGSEFLNHFLQGHNFVPGYSAVFRKRCLDSVGGFHFDLGPQADYFPNHAVPSKFGGVFIPEVMTCATVMRDNSNYCSKATEAEKIERHAKFEKRMRSLGMPRIEKQTWNDWRVKLIQDIAPNNQTEAHIKFLCIVGE